MDILDCVTITPELVDSFEPLIPSGLLDELRGETVAGLGSMLGEMPNGALIFQIEGHAARILSLYVDQYDRRNGTGRFLVEKLCEILKGVPGIYSVRMSLPEEDVGSAAFFEAVGARVEPTESFIARFPLSALENSPLFAVPVSPHCIPGTKLGSDVLSYFQRLMQKDGTYLMEGELWASPVCQDLSWYYVNDKMIQGCIVVTKTNEGYSLALMVNYGSAQVLPMLLGRLLATMAENFPPETELSLEAAVPESRKLLDRFVPSAVKSHRRVAVLAV